MSTYDDLKPEVRLIGIGKDNNGNQTVAVFENTEKAAITLREMLLSITGWTISLQAMIDTLNDSNKIPSSNKKIVLDDILDIKIIK